MNRTSATRHYKSLPFLLIVFCLLCSRADWSKREASFVKRIPPISTARKKNKINSSRQDKGKTGSGFGTRNIFAERRLVTGRQTNTDAVRLYWILQSLLSAVHVAGTDDVPAAGDSMFSRSNHLRSRRRLAAAQRLGPDKLLPLHY